MSVPNSVRQQIQQAITEKMASPEDATTTSVAVAQEPTTETEIPDADEVLDEGVDYGQESIAPDPNLEPGIEWLDEGLDRIARMVGIDEPEVFGSVTALTAAIQLQMRQPPQQRQNPDTQKPAEEVKPVEFELPEELEDAALDETFGESAGAVKSIMKLFQSQIASLEKRHADELKPVTELRKQNEAAQRNSVVAWLDGKIAEQSEKDPSLAQVFGKGRYVTGSSIPQQNLQHRFKVHSLFNKLLAGSPEDDPNDLLETAMLVVSKKKQPPQKNSRRIGQPQVKMPAAPAPKKSTTLTAGDKDTAAKELEKWMLEKRLSELEA